ncbi:MAG TPA: flagellar hook-length control protein FliK [bacterium]|nr:flagellar hook-length control protein FliK [bacterium]
MPVNNQSGLNSFESRIHNFNSIMSQIMGSEPMADKATVENALIENPAVRAAVYQAVTMMHVMGRTNELSLRPHESLAQDTALKTIVNENGLSAAEQKIFVSAVKIAAVLMAADNNTAAGKPVPLSIAEEGTALRQGIEARSNLNSADAQQNTGVLPGEKTNMAETIGGVKTDTADAKTNTGINAADVKINAALNPADITSTSVISPAHTNTGKAEVVQYIAVKPGVQAVDGEQAVKTAAFGTVYGIAGTEVIKGAFTQAGNVLNQPQPQADVQAAKIISANDAARADAPADKTVNQAQAAPVNRVPEKLDELVQLLKGMISNLITVRPDAPDNSRPAQPETEALRVSLERIDGSIAALKGAVSSGDKTAEKIIAEKLLAEINSLVIAAEKIIIASLGAYKGDAAGNNAAVAAGKSGFQGGNNPGGNYGALAAPLIDGINETLAKIFVLLKSMNGEINIQNSTAYVYKPYSNSSSQVTPDGVLLINTAKAEGFRPIVIPVPNEISADAAKQPGQEQALTRENTIISNNTQAVKPAAEALFTEPARPAVLAAAAAQNEPAALKAQAVPAADAGIRNSAETAVKVPVVSEAAAYAGLKDFVSKNVREEMKWATASINETYITSKESRDIQAPVNTKVFESIRDFAVRVREAIVIKQVVTNIQNGADNIRKTGINIILRPESLGRVVVRLEAVDNRVLIGKIETVTGEARDIIRANIGELRQALSNIGYNVESFDVSAQGRDAGSRGSANSFDEWQGAALTDESAGANVMYFEAGDGHLDFLA